MFGVIGVGSDLCGPGSDLLSRVLRRSTIGAGEFHGRVRDGIGCLSPRHSHQAGEDQKVLETAAVGRPDGVSGGLPEGDRVCRRVRMVYGRDGQG